MADIPKLPQNVVSLVIAAREAFDTGMLPDDEQAALDKALEPFASAVPYENEPALSTLSADAIRQGEGERGFCNKCGFVGVPQKGGFHYRPKDGQPCNYICPVSATPASHASDGGKA